MTIYLALTLYSLLTLAIALPCGRRLQRYPSLRSATPFCLLVIFWPVSLVCGIVLVCCSAEMRKLAHEINRSE